jgi:hypothetical protein
MEIASLSKNARPASHVYMLLKAHERVSFKLLCDAILVEYFLSFQIAIPSGSDKHLWFLRCVNTTVSTSMGCLHRQSFNTHLSPSPAKAI